MESAICTFLIVCLVAVCVIPILSTFIRDGNVWYDKKHGMKYKLTSSSLTYEWDFSSPLTRLRFLKLFIECEFMEKTRNKYIREYTNLKKSLENDGYDLSDFPDYEQKKL